MSIDYGVFNLLFFDEYKDIQWFNKKGVYKINDQKRAEITLSTFGYSESYEGYCVKIINKDDGVITSHSFKFADYISKNSRIDNRKNKNDKYYYDSGNYHLNGNCLENKTPTDINDFWYIMIPSRESVNVLAQRIFDFIKIYE